MDAKQWGEVVCLGRHMGVSHTSIQNIRISIIEEMLDQIKVLCS